MSMKYDECVVNFARPFTRIDYPKVAVWTNFGVVKGVMISGPSGWVPGAGSRSLRIITFESYGPDRNAICPDSAAAERLARLHAPCSLRLAS